MGKGCYPVGLFDVAVHMVQCPDPPGTVTVNMLEEFREYRLQRYLVKVPATISTPSEALSAVY